MMVIVTELLLGGTLRKYLVSLRPKRLDIRLAVAFALDIARAMECLHSHGIIHRDLKPENLILSADHKTVKLADFGLAREESLTEMMTAETGTYRWMAPEFIGACKEPMMVIVTELLLGGTLRKYLVSLRPKRLDIRLAVAFALDIARAMECLHSHGIIHRDLKPENLILSADHKTVKLADFGLAREESLTEMMTAETGTYRWMAPELPFEGMSNLQAAYAAAFKNLRPSAEDLPGELGLIVTSCWKEDPNERPNFTEIIQMLLRYLSTVSPPQIVPPPVRRVFSSENVVFSPDSPGTCSLMNVREKDGSGQNVNAADSSEKETKGSFFFCCS
ncbi:hypothetical protein F2Q68_00036370 [Brassica cretica]|uniref:Protein kinase domain-containing protein n=1 Tax=Brassica cretica TaxID=69181 RepID=A0A8S9H1F3_BRACR|nr:hypothetical protein F2Q68_00036370 [Brassica cretica]